MKKIASFTVDHRTLDIGMYISREDGDIVTYDVRMVKPNGGLYLSYPSIHTIEHLFATFARNTPEENHVVYVGPMGCRTGFYFITRKLQHADAIRIVKESMAFIRDFAGEIPGAAEIECGNYLEHDLQQAKRDIEPILQILQNYNMEKLRYN